MVRFTQAIKQVLTLEEASHGKDDDLEVLKQAPFDKVIPRLLRPLETGGRSIKPCLVHSDLWPRNSMPDADTGEIMISTPALSRDTMKWILAAGGHLGTRWGGLFSKHIRA